MRFPHSQGEARWDDQAAVGVTNSQALVEYGYQNALAQSTAASSGAAAADQSVLTDFYGKKQASRYKQLSNTEAVTNRVVPVQA